MTSHCKDEFDLVPDEFFSKHNSGCNKLHATSQKHKHTGCVQLVQSIEEDEEDIIL